MNVVPSPTTLCTSRLPLCLAITCRQTGNPSPMPCILVV